MSISSYGFSDSEPERSIRLVKNNPPYNAACEKCSSRHISLCNVLDADELKKFSKISTNFHKNAKQIICSEDENADHIYNIKSGAVRISKMLSDGRRQITGFLFAGDFFGLSCKDRYSYTAEAITDVSICRFPRAKIIKSFQDFPALGERAFDMTRTELESTYDQMLLLGRKTAKEKLCTFLFTMWQKSDRPGVTNKDEVPIPMSRSDIADYLGLTIETISRQFTHLHKLGLIELDGAHKVFLKNPAALSAMAEGD
ncbi:MAG: Crp/Fnr family transcriptional regulator [Alphaproteobacteria bacterium]|nr:MAG: Crp/Fnr family transcriptional regulator [Alphaproteobacteria bacterium]